MVTCEKEHDKATAALKDAPKSQKIALRHTCAGCAYDQGFIDGLHYAHRVIGRALGLVVEAGQE